MSQATVNNANNTIVNAGGGRLWLAGQSPEYDGLIGAAYSIGKGRRVPADTFCRCLALLALHVRPLVRTVLTLATLFASTGRCQETVDIGA